MFLAPGADAQYETPFELLIKLLCLDCRRRRNVDVSMAFGTVSLVLTRITHPLQSHQYFPTFPSTHQQPVPLPVKGVHE
jgi:hypothetical protein